MLDNIREEQLLVCLSSPFHRRTFQKLNLFNVLTPATYAQNSSTSEDPAKLDEDEARQDELPWVVDFHAERTCSLSLFVYDSNKKLAEDTDAPSWGSKEPVPGSKEWEKSPNAQVFGDKAFVGSNVIATTGGFRNGVHCDFDATGFASGFFCLIDANTC